MFGPSSSTAWVALILAGAVRTILGRPRSIATGLSIFFVSITLGWMFAPALIAWLALDPAVYGVPVIGFVVLVSHGVSTTIVKVLSDIETLKSLLNAWRGR